MTAPTGDWKQHGSEPAEDPRPPQTAGQSYSFRSRLIIVGVGVLCAAAYHFAPHFVWVPFGTELAGALGLLVAAVVVWMIRGQKP